MSTLLQELSANQEAMKTWRHHMHRHPEVAFDEHKTASYIAGLLREWGYEVMPAGVNILAVHSTDPCLQELRKA